MAAQRQLPAGTQLYNGARGSIITHDRLYDKNYTRGASLAVHDIPKMITLATAVRPILVISAYFLVRVIAKYRVDRRRRAGLVTPLVDPVLLETTFAPRGGEDADLLSEMCDTLKVLNRQKYAEEFWNVDAQLIELDEKLPETVRPALRSAMLRLLDTEDRWLQIVGAKTSAGLKLTEARSHIETLVAAIPDDGPAGPNVRFRDELLAAISKLDE